MFYLAGTSRNIYFPFDTVSDTPLGVAVEMIKELDLVDWEPNEISYMIEGEVSSLLPRWKKWDQLGPNSSLDYQDVVGDSFHLRSDSSCSSSQASFSGLIMSLTFSLLCRFCLTT